MEEIQIEVPLRWLLAFEWVELVLWGTWAWVAWKRRQNFEQSWQAKVTGYATAAFGRNGSPTRTDTLDYKQVADELAGLLANPSTDPPFTLALVGDWGTGKSSLMQQMEVCLTDTEFTNGQPFKAGWVNVWHAQSGENLTGSILREVLRLCGSNATFIKRWHFWLNAHRARVNDMSIGRSLWLGSATVTLAALIWYATVKLLQPVGLWLGGYQNLKEGPKWLSLGWIDASEWYVQLFGGPFRLLEQLPELHGKDSAWAVIGGSILLVLSAFVELYRNMRDYNDFFRELVPGKLFELAMSEDSGYKMRFRDELRRIARAAPSGTQLVIFVEDIDRVEGTQVLELLSTLDFIINSTRELTLGIYFVLAMSLEEVVRTLGLALAKQEPDERKRDLLAARYLEKIVDLPQPVPVVSTVPADKLLTLLLGKAPAQ